jgi:hypothetical protein
MKHAKHPGQVEITFRYARHVGPMHVHGGLTLQFDELKPYAFVSRAQWPARLTTKRQFEKPFSRSSKNVKDIRHQRSLY